MRNFTLSIILALFFFSSHAFSTANTTHVSAYSYAGGTVTTSAYVQIIASTAITVSKIEVCDTSTKIIKLATGAAGSEVDLVTIPVSGCILIPVYLVAGTRLSIEAIDASATTGYNLVSLVQ